MNRLTAQILVVGGGPAGLAAAAAASRRASVTIVDNNPSLGGQIWRAELGRSKRDLANSNVRVMNGQVFDHTDNKLVLMETCDGRAEIEYEKLIIATGARELFLPFPGWTLPNVFGAGGLQALVKGGLKVANKRVVVAGTGPLLLAVAAYLRSKGARVVAVAEQASAPMIRKFALGLWRAPNKLAQATVLKARLLGVSYLTECCVNAARGAGELQQVELVRKGHSWTVDCDMLASGYHLVPNVELASLVGCKIEHGFVAVDESQQTSIVDVYCAGEPTGITGVDAALVEGTIAGLAATGEIDRSAARFFGQRDKYRKFGMSLNAAFALRDELRSLPAADTIICRCEDVAYGRLKDFDNFREAKLQTRCGMGACQGRICGAATNYLFGWDAPSVRPPIFPVKMENL